MRKDEMSARYCSGYFSITPFLAVDSLWEYRMMSYNEEAEVFCVFRFFLNYSLRKLRAFFFFARL